MRPLTFLLLTSASVLAVAHFFALHFYLYWIYLWLDIPMHILGGATVALVFFVIDDFAIPYVPRIRRFLPFILAVFAVGLLWEFFEVWAGVATQSNYWQDTIGDLAMDIVGGSIGYIVASRIRTLEV